MTSNEAAIAPIHGLPQDLWIECLEFLVLKEIAISSLSCRSLSKTGELVAIRRLLLMVKSIEEYSSDRFNQCVTFNTIRFSSEKWMRIHYLLVMIFKDVGFGKANCTNPTVESLLCSNRWDENMLDLMCYTMWLLFGCKSSFRIHESISNSKRCAEKVGKSLRTVLKKNSTLCCEERILQSAKRLSDSDLPCVSDNLLDCLRNNLYAKKAILDTKIEEIEGNKDMVWFPAFNTF